MIERRCPDCGAWYEKSVGDCPACGCPAARLNVGLRAAKLNSHLHSMAEGSNPKEAHAALSDRYRKALAREA